MRELETRRSTRPVAPRMSTLTVNGVTTIVVEEHSLPVVRFIIAMRHGSGHDPDRSAGATRLLLELLLRGTENRSRREFHETLEELGSSLYVAGSHETGLMRGVTLTRNLPTTFGLAAEALTRPALETDEQRRLTEESVAELRAARDDDDSVAEIFLRRALYPDHPFGRSPAGEIRDLLRLDNDTLREIYEQRLANAELVIGFAGDVTPAIAEKLVSKLTAELPPELPAPLPDLSALPDPPGTRVLVVDKPGRTQTQLRVARLACDGRHPAALPFWLGTVAFGGTFTSPFTREVREVRGWSYGASASFDRRRRHRAPFVLHTAPALSDTFDCLALELELYGGLCRGELEEAPIERARSYLLNRYPFQIATAADMLTPAIAAELLGHPHDELDKLPAALAAITPEQVRAACTELLDPTRLVVVLVAPAKEAVPVLHQRLPAARVDVVDFRDGLDI